MCTEYFSSNTALLAEVQKLFERAQTVEKASWRQFMARRFCSLLITWVECTGEQLCQDKGFRAAITKVSSRLAIKVERVLTKNKPCFSFS